MLPHGETTHVAVYVRLPAIRDLPSQGSSRQRQPLRLQRTPEELQKGLKTSIPSRPNQLKAPLSLAAKILNFSKNLGLGFWKYSTSGVMSRQPPGHTPQQELPGTDHRLKPDYQEAGGPHLLLEPNILFSEGKTW